MAKGRQHNWEGTQIALIIPNEVLRWIEEEAKNNYQSRTEYIRTLLVRAKRQNESAEQHGPIA